MKDYYKILGVSKNAKPEEIKRAFRRLAQKHHPDKGGDPEKFKEINEAYQILSNPEKKAQYDQFGTTFEAGQNQGGGFGGFGGFQNGGFQNNWDFSSFGEDFDLGDIFSSFFGGENRSKNTQKKQGRDIKVDLELKLNEIKENTIRTLNLYKWVSCPVCHGTGAKPGSKLKTCSRCKGKGTITETSRQGFFAFSRTKTCPECGGSGKIPEEKCPRCNGLGRIKDEVKLKVKIPAGVEDGQIIRLAEQGEAGEFGGPNGDLYLIVHIQPDPNFKRDGANLIQTAKINFIQAILGDVITIPTIDGRQTKLKIPAGTQPNAQIRIKDGGLPYLKRNQRGDLIIKIIVEIPKRISKKAKKLLEELKKEL